MCGSKPTSACYTKHASELIVDEENNERNSGCIESLGSRREGKEGKRKDVRDGQKNKNLRKEKIKDFPDECQNVPELPHKEEK